MGRKSLFHGKRAEDIANQYLIHEGFIILDRNWSCKYGELDVVAAKQGRLYFFEVKYRENANFGYPFEYINQAKLKRLLITIELYLCSKNLLKVSWNLDGLCLFHGNGTLYLRWFRDILV